MKPLALVGIAGGTCSGKSLVASRVAEAVGAEKVLVCKQDNYYRDLKDLKPGERSHWDFDRPESFDYDLLINNIKSIMAGNAVQEPVYSFVEHSRTGKFRTLHPREVVILEGILVLNNEHLRQMMDFRVFVDEEPDIRLVRRLKRDEIERGRSPQSVIQQYIESVRPAHEKFVKTSRQYADIIIPQGGENLRAIEILSNHIRSLISRQ